MLLLHLLNMKLQFSKGTELYSWIFKTYLEMSQQAKFNSFELKPELPTAKYP